MEIEVKVHLRDREAFVAKLKALGCELSEPKTQDDTVYVRKTGTVEDFISNDVFLRIRIQNGSKVIFTAKAPITKSAEELVKQEYETIIESVEQARGILKLAGFREAVHIVKTRRTAKCKGYEICIDDVDGLGAFVEVESITDDPDVRRVQKEMFDFLLSLGVSPEDQVKKGYDILMLETLASKA